MTTEPESALDRLLSRLASYKGCLFVTLPAEAVAPPHIETGPPRDDELLAAARAELAELRQRCEDAELIVRVTCRHDSFLAVERGASGQWRLKSYENDPEHDVSANLEASENEVPILTAEARAALKEQGRG